MANYLEFREELETLINKYSMEGRSDTPDFILANYLTACLVAYDNALIERQELIAPNQPTKADKE
jgi:hypothetical protein